VPAPNVPRFALETVHERRGDPAKDFASCGVSHICRESTLQCWSTAEERAFESLKGDPGMTGCRLPPFDRRKTR
jgi:hypothetical protein